MALGTPFVVGITLDELTDHPTPRGGTTALTGDLAEQRAATLEVLRCGGPTMVFQPVVGLPTGAPVGVEALARFGLGAAEDPASWFDRATVAGLGVELECSAIAAALPVLARLEADQFLAVNASPATVCSAAFRIVMAGVPMPRILLELTEHTPVVDYEALNAALAPYRRAGMRIAVDDLGAGHATLLHALSVGPDVVKLDRSLITGIGSDRRRLILVAALVGWAEASGMAVIAEGVEHPEELAALLDIGVHQAQGFLFGRPAERLVVGCRRRRQR